MRDGDQVNEGPYTVEHTGRSPGATHENGSLFNAKGEHCAHLYGSEEWFTDVCARLNAPAPKPTLDDLLDALKRGDLVAKAAANAKGIAITFAVKDSGRSETIPAQMAGRPPFVLPGQRNARLDAAAQAAFRANPSITRGQELAGIQEAENDLQKRLVDILVEECASESQFPLEQRIHSRVEDVVAPVTPEPDLIAHKARWFTGKCMELLSRRNRKKVTRDDLVMLVRDIASSGKRGKTA